MAEKEKSLEHTILEELWSSQGSTPLSKLQETFEGPLSTELMSMEERGLIKECGPSTYEAMIDLEGYRKKVMEELIDREFDGDVIAMLKTLIHMTPPEKRDVFRQALAELPSSDTAKGRT